MRLPFTKYNYCNRCNQEKRNCIKVDKSIFVCSNCMFEKNDGYSFNEPWMEYNEDKGLWLCSHCRPPKWFQDKNEYVTHHYGVHQ